MPQIYALLGRKRSGKDTTTFILKQHLNGTTTEFSFAEPLKKSLENLLGVERYHFHDQTKKEELLPQFNHTPRALMQWYGQMIKEKLGGDFWINQLRNKIQKCPSDYVIVTDCRTTDEVKMLLEFDNTVVVFLTRNNDSNDTDISETSVDEALRWMQANIRDSEKAKYIINNSHSVKILEETIVKVVLNK